MAQSGALGEAKVLLSFFAPLFVFGSHTLRPGVVQGTSDVGALRRDGSGAWADSNGFAQEGLVSLRNTTLAARTRAISEGWMTRGAKRISPFQAHRDRTLLNENREKGASTCNPHLSVVLRFRKRRGV